MEIETAPKQDLSSRSRIDKIVLSDDEISAVLRELDPAGPVPSSIVTQPPTRLFQRNEYLTPPLHSNTAVSAAGISENGAVLYPKSPTLAVPLLSPALPAVYAALSIIQHDDERLNAVERRRRLCRSIAAALSEERRIIQHNAMLDSMLINAKEATKSAASQTALYSFKPAFESMNARGDEGKRTVDTAEEKTYKAAIDLESAVTDAIFNSRRLLVALARR